MAGALARPALGAGERAAAPAGMAQARFRGQTCGRESDPLRSRRFSRDGR